MGPLGGEGWSLKEEIIYIKGKLDKISDGQEVLARIVAADHALLHQHLESPKKPNGLTVKIKHLFGIGG